MEFLQRYEMNVNYTVCFFDNQIIDYNQFSGLETYKKDPHSLFGAAYSQKARDTFIIASGLEIKSRTQIKEERLINTSWRFGSASRDLHSMGAI